MALPKFQTDDQSLSLLQSAWASQLDPVLANPVAEGRLIVSVALVTGANVINHKLGRKLKGWMLVRQRAAGTAYDTQDSNSMPQLTLQLTSSANMTVDIYVF